jgi:hypothetical protein
MITDIKLLTKQECLEIRSAIYKLKELWIQRHPVAPFYTLGASNYFDIAHNPHHNYYKTAKYYNSILLEHLGWLYQRLANTLAEILEAPTTYPETLALPGFHIFLAHKYFEKMRALTHQEWFRTRYDPEVVSSPIHCDTPHTVVDWGTSEPVDFSHPVSFTLAISLPKSGAGMYVWNLHLEETIGLNKAALLHLLHSREKSLHSYQVGWFTLHSGLMYHQVAPMQNLQPDDERITLQGHGLLHKRKWQLYW